MLVLVRRLSPSRSKEEEPRDEDEGRPSLVEPEIPLGFDPAARGLAEAKTYDYESDYEYGADPDKLVAPPTHFPPTGQPGTGV